MPVDQRPIYNPVTGRPFYHPIDFFNVPSLNCRCCANVIGPVLCDSCTGEVPPTFRVALTGMTLQGDGAVFGDSPSDITWRFLSAPNVSVCCGNIAAAAAGDTVEPAGQFCIPADRPLDALCMASIGCALGALELDAYRDGAKVGSAVGDVHVEYSIWNLSGSGNRIVCAFVIARGTVDGQPVTATLGIPGALIAAAPNTSCGYGWSANVNYGVGADGNPLTCGNTPGETFQNVPFCNGTWSVSAEGCHPSVCIGCPPNHCNDCCDVIGVQVNFTGCPTLDDGRRIWLRRLANSCVWQTDDGRNILRCTDQQKWRLTLYDPTGACGADKKIVFEAPVSAICPAGLTFSNILWAALAVVENDFVGTHVARVTSIICNDCIDCCQRFSVTTKDASDVQSTSTLDRNDFPNGCHWGVSGTEIVHEVVSTGSQWTLVLGDSIWTTNATGVPCPPESASAWARVSGTLTLVSISCSTTVACTADCSACTVLTNALSITQSGVGVAGWDDTMQVDVPGVCPMQASNGQLDATLECPDTSAGLWELTIFKDSDGPTGEHITYREPSDANGCPPDTFTNVVENTVVGSGSSPVATIDA